MKNNQNLVSFSPEKGVHLYFADSKMTDIIDIDVEPGIRSIVLSGPNANSNRLSRNVKLRNIFKQFPDVEELVIQEDIMDIDISNFMFPNVRNVDSNNPYFLNCQYLVRSIVVNKILKNVFCIKPDEQIQPLYDINIIDDYAFEGCQVASFFNNDTSFNTIHTISHHAFDGSSFFDIPSKNGLKRVGNIVFGVDDDAEEIEFPEGTKCVLPTDIDYKNVKRAVIRNIKNVNEINKLPETIVIADTEFSKNNMFGIYMYLNTTNVSCIEASPSSGFVSKDGILYSGDISCLILCPIKKTGDIIVPEGVTCINDFAFYRTRIDSVTFPSSLKNIKKEAFRQSKIRKIGFGSGIKKIGNNASNIFADCQNLTHVEFPPQVTDIGHSAFFNCRNLKSVTMHEEISTIGRRAFAWCEKLKSVTLPKSIKYAGELSFSCVQELHTPHLFSGLPYAFLSTTVSSPIKKLIVGDNEFFVPASLSSKALYTLNQQCSNGYLCKSDLHNLYQGAENTKLKQDTAYYIYKHNPGADAELEKYLKRCAKQIALRYIEENKDDELVEFIGCKLLSKSAIKQLLQAATEAGKPSIAAYLLTQIHGKPSSKFTL